MTRSPARAPAIDAGLGLLAAAALLVEEQVRNVAGAGSWGHVLLAAAVGAVISQRRRAPVAALGTALALLLAALQVLRAGYSTLAIVMLLAATVAYHGDRRRSLLLGMALVPALIAFVAVSGDLAHHDYANLADFVPLLAAVAVADAARHRVDARAARADRTRVLQTAAVREMFDAHRLHLARELHDSVAHALVAINTSAAVATHLHGRTGDPHLVSVLEDVKATSAAALRELRETLAGLRASDEQVPLRPGASGLENIAALVQPLRAAGLQVNLACSPETAALSGATAHAAYRITQEALTNVLRHSGARAVDVELQVNDRQLQVEVTDDGSPSTSDAHPGRGPFTGVVESTAGGSGQGLRGMRERAGSVGGSVKAGPCAGGGWRVSAQLPLDVAS